MSRSRWASTKDCAPAGAATRGLGERAGLGAETGLERKHLLGAASSTTRLFWVVAALVVALAFGPAVAFARPGCSSRQQLAIRGRDLSAELLGPGSGYNSPDGWAQVRTLQRRLARAGYSPGPIDGLYGPLTERAVSRFQTAQGLQVDGTADSQTLAALSAPTPVLYPGAGYEPGDSGPVRALQGRLARAGYSPGPVDGLYGPLTERAVSRLQTAHGLQIDGIAGPQTIAHLRDQRRSHEPPHQPSQHPLQRRSHPLRSRPSVGSRQSTRAPTSSSVRPGTHATGSSPVGWIVLLGALGLGLLVAVTRHGRRGRLTSPGPSDRGASAVLERPAGAGMPLDERKTVAGANAADAVGGRGGDEGAFKLAVLLEEKGDARGAKAAYRRADRRGHAAAASSLGVLLEEQGDVVGARAAYGRADQRGDANGAFNLGMLLEERGDPSGASDAYGRADQRGHGAAAANLGVLLENQGDLTGARAAYGRADQRGDANGALNLGMLLEEQGDLAGAIAAYRRAGERGDPRVARMARAALLDLRGDLRGPRAGSGGGHHVA